MHAPLAGDVHVRREKEDSRMPVEKLIATALQTWNGHNL